jgi:hypothetical protein
MILRVSSKKWTAKEYVSSSSSSKEVSIQNQSVVCSIRRTAEDWTSKWLLSVVGELRIGKVYKYSVNKVLSVSIQQ